MIDGAFLGGHGRFLKGVGKGGNGYAEVLAQLHGQKKFFVRYQHVGVAFKRI
jgi:hypothetical protein